MNLIDHIKSIFFPKEGRIGAPRQDTVVQPQLPAQTESKKPTNLPKELSIRELNREATRPIRPKTFSNYSVHTEIESIEITDEYRLVEQLLNSKAPLIFVSGKAGTGKSTLIKHLRRTYKKNIVVVAPTGVAALNVGGSTIHKYFRFPPRVLNSEDIRRLNDRDLYTKLDLLVIDEISMVRADVIDAIDEFLRLNGKNSKLPFGGTQVLMIGDMFQLPPVVDSQQETTLFSRAYTSPYFFSGKSLQPLNMQFVELSKVFRQRDESFVMMLDAIRIPDNIVQELAEINSRCLVRDENLAVTLTCTNKVADHINISRLGELVGPKRTFVGKVAGEFDLNRSNFPSPIELELKLGAQVMFTKNGKGWVNGSIGRVVGFSETSVQVEMLTEEPGTIHDVQRVIWESFKYEYDYVAEKIVVATSGTYEQFPLMLAWAITIHKSQGKTLAKVHVDLGSGAFAPGQVYVALSRCRSLENISLERPIKSSDVFCDDRIRRFYTAVATRRP